MSKSTCKNTDCNRSDHMKLGMCSKHYRAHRAALSPCAAEGCSSGMVYRATGYCSSHHRAAIKSGSAQIDYSRVHKAQYTPDGLRICKTCGEAKPLGDYHRDRNGSDGYRAQCKPCRGAYMASYHSENREARAAYMQSRMKAHGDHVRALDMARYERHKEKRVALASENVKIRRARLAGVETDPLVNVPALRGIHGDNCCYCGIEMSFERRPRGEGIAPNRATLEHVLPISRGGAHTFENTALACHRCNVTKNNKTLDEWSPRPHAFS